MREETLEQVRKSVQQKYDETLREMVGQNLPQPRFYNFIETEGFEFPVTVNLMCSFNYYDEWSGIKEWFLTAVTRATTKLVIVHNNEHIDEPTGLNELTERDPGKLGSFVRQAETNDWKTVIVGCDYNYPIFLSPTTESQLPLDQPDLPNVEGIKMILSRKGVRFLQIDDLYKEDDIKELLKFGWTSVIIVGGRNQRNMFNWKFYQTAQYIMESAAFLCQFRVFNVCSSFYLDADSKCHLHAFLQHQATTNPKLSLDQVKQVQEIMSNKTPDLEEASCSWQTWKAKGNQLYCLELPHKALETYYFGKILLMRQIEINIVANNASLEFLTKELAKFFTNKSKMWIKLAKRVCKENEIACASKFFGEKCSLNLCFAMAVWEALVGFLLNMSWDRINDRLTEIKQALTAKFSYNLNLDEQNVKLKKRIEEEREQKTVLWMRDLSPETSRILTSPVFTNDCTEICVPLIEMHQRIYKSADPTNMTSLIEQRTLLAEGVAKELEVLLKELRNCDKGKPTAVIKMIISINWIIMEVLEWNPYNPNMILKLFEFISIIIDLIKDLQTAEKKKLENGQGKFTIEAWTEIEEMITEKIFTVLEEV